MTFDGGLRFQLIFITMLFSVAFFGDLVLNDFSRHPLSNYHENRVIKSLEPYFRDKSIIESGVYAGLTVVNAYILVMSLWFSMGLGMLPTREAVYSALNVATLKKIAIEIGLVFVLGYVIDVFIDKMRVFGDSLDTYYSVAGAGLWGALAFVFSVVASYSLLRILSRK